MQVLVLRFGVIGILINSDFRDLRIRYQNLDKSLAISGCGVVIIIFLRVKQSLSVRNSSFFQFLLPNIFFYNSIN